MAKADKNNVSTDKSAEEKSEVTDAIIDAEVVEETTAEDGNQAKDVSEEIEAEEPPIDSVDQDPETSVTDEIGDNPEATKTVEVEEPSEVETTDSDAPEDSEVLQEDPETFEEEYVDWRETDAPRGRGFLPMLLGGVAAAAIGFGAALVFGVTSGADEAVIARLYSDIRKQSRQIETLSGLIDASTNSSATALAAANGLGEKIEANTAGVAGFSSQMEDIASALADLDARIIGLEKRPLSQGLPSSAIQAYERELEELKSSVAAQRAEAAEMERNARNTARDALARAALSRVSSAIESGASYRSALTDFRNTTGIRPNSVLEASADLGVPTLAKLQAGFPDAARKALAEARKTQDEQGNRFSSFLKSQLGARSVAPKDGQDADAILSRAEESLRSGNVSATLAEIALLPQTAQDAMAGWISEARTRLNAADAAAALLQQLNTN